MGASPESLPRKEPSRKAMGFFIFMLVTREIGATLYNN